MGNKSGKQLLPTQQRLRAKCSHANKPMHQTELPMCNCYLASLGISLDKGIYIHRVGENSLVNRNRHSHKMLSEFICIEHIPLGNIFFHPCAIFSQSVELFNNLWPSFLLFLPNISFPATLNGLWQDLIIGRNLGLLMTFKEPSTYNHERIWTLLLLGSPHSKQTLNVCQWKDASLFTLEANFSIWSTVSSICQMHLLYFERRGWLINGCAVCIGSYQYLVI